MDYEVLENKVVKVEDRRDFDDFHKMERLALGLIDYRDGGEFALKVKQGVDVGILGAVVSSRLKDVIRSYQDEATSYMSEDRRQVLERKMKIANDLVDDFREGIKGDYVAHVFSKILE